LPKDVKYWIREANKYSKSGNIRLQVNAYNNMVLLEPNNPKFLLYRAVGLGKLGFLDRALEVVEKSLSIDPNNSFPWYFKGYFLYKKEDHLESLDALKKAYALDPEDVRTLLLLTLVYGVFGMRDEATKCGESAREIEPEYVAHYLQGLKYTTEGKPLKAKAEFDFCQQLLARSETLDRALL
jgi:tetratricopeptide (TPR) repeat protein